MRFTSFGSRTNILSKSGSRQQYRIAALLVLGRPVLLRVHMNMLSISCVEMVAVPELIYCIRYLTRYDREKVKHLKEIK